MVFYSSKIFERVTDDTTMIFLLSLSTNVAMFVCAFVAGVVSSKYGRKTILMIGSICCCLFLGIFGMILLPSNT